jgi:hypothetical protein
MSVGEYSAPNKYGRFRPLPPPDFWLEDPYKIWCPTIVDDRGIPQPDETLSQILSLLAPEYRGIKDINKNHFAYPGSLYPNTPYEAVNPHEYRNQTPLTRLMPIDIHNFLHLVLEPSTPPPKEVMSESIEAWQKAKRLFNQARAIKRADELYATRIRNLRNNPGIKEKIGESDDTDLEYLLSNIDNRLRGFEDRIEAYESVPEEFRPVNIDSDLEPVMLAEQIVSVLGKVVLPQVVRPSALELAA